MSQDVVERAREFVARDIGGRSGYEHNAITLIEELIKEVEFLRSHAGAITRGESFDDIAKRVGRQTKDEQSS